MSIQKINHNGKTVIHVTFAGLNEESMIKQVDEVVKMMLAENTSQRMIYEYDRRNYATTKYVRHLEDATRQVIHLGIESAVVAEMSLSKKMILKAYNFIFNRNVVAFETYEEALRHLTDEKA